MPMNWASTPADTVSVTVTWRHSTMPMADPTVAPTLVVDARYTPAVELP